MRENKLKNIFGALVVFAVISLFAGFAPPAEASSFTVYGTVSYNGVPTGDINIAVNDVMATASGIHEILGTAKTNAAGDYQVNLVDLPPGQGLTVFASYLPYYALQNIAYNGTDLSAQVDLNIIPSAESMVSITVKGMVDDGNIQTPVNDVTPPVITVLGNSLINLNIGDTYADAGATALDETDGNLTSAIVALSNVNTAAAGTYTVNYSVSDAAGNTASTSRAVIVSVSVPPPASDVAPPVITILGSNPAEVAQGSVYTDPGATAVDETDGVLSVNTIGVVHTSVRATFILTYTAIDAAGNVATVNRMVTVVAANNVPSSDTVSPVITLLGSNPATITSGSVYIDAGATALDETDGNLTSAIVALSNVNTAAAGAYTVNYSVSDAAGNTALASRTVIVSSPALPPPVIVDRVHVNPDVAATIIGGTIRFTAEARDANNAPLASQPAIIWSMKNNNTTAGNVDSNGLFKAIASGVATVVATMDGVIGQADINVLAPVCQTAADTNLDGAIGNLEMLNYLRDWKAGTVTNLLMLRALVFWKAGIGC